MYTKDRKLATTFITKTLSYLLAKVFRIQECRLYTHIIFLQNQKTLKAFTLHNVNTTQLITTGRFLQRNVYFCHMTFELTYTINR